MVFETPKMGVASEKCYICSMFVRKKHYCPLKFVFLPIGLIFNLKMQN
jgi:hypothetical protein